MKPLGHVFKFKMHLAGFLHIVPHSTYLFLEDLHFWQYMIASMLKQKSTLIKSLFHYCLFFKWSQN